MKQRRNNATQLPSLQDYLSSYQTGMVFLGLLSLTITSSIWIGINSKAIAQQTRHVLDEKIQHSMRAIVADGIRNVNQKWAHWESILKVHAYLRQDQIIPDYPYRPPPESVMYMDDVSLLTSRTYSPLYRNNQLPISFGRSSYHIPNKRPSDIQNFTAATNETIGRHFVFDSTTLAMVLKNPNEILSLYSCTVLDSTVLETRKKGLTVEAPAVGADSSISPYNCLNEAWPVEAINAYSSLREDGVTISDPYVDRHVFQHMISMTMIVRKLDDWNGVSFAGIVGMDILLDDLKRIVNRVQFQGVSQVQWVSQRNTSLQVGDSFSIPEWVLLSPAGPTDAEPRVYDVNVQEPGESESDYFYAIQETLVSGYVLVARVPRSYVENKMQPLIDQHNTSAWVVALLYPVIVIGLVALALYLTFQKSSAIAASFPRVCEELERIPREHIGAAYDLNGVRQIPLPDVEALELPLEEEHALVSALVKPIQLLNVTRMRTNRYPENPNYRPRDISVLNAVVGTDDDQKHSDSKHSSLVATEAVSPIINMILPQHPQNVFSSKEGESKCQDRNTVTSDIKIDFKEPHPEKIQPMEIINTADMPVHRSLRIAPPPKPVRRTLQSSLLRIILPLITLGGICLFVVTLVPSLVVFQVSTTLANRMLHDTYTEMATSRLYAMSHLTNQHFEHAAFWVERMQNDTDQATPNRNRESRMSRLYWARTNAEDMSLPPMDGAGYSRYAAHFKRGVTSYTELEATRWVNESSLMVNLWRPILRANPALDQVYVGYNNGLIAWLERTWKRADEYETGRFYDSGSRQYQIGYEPAWDEWFRRGMALSDVGSRAAFTPPYFDASTRALTTTCYLGLRSQPGVVAADLDMASIQNAVQTGNLSAAGYVVLFQQETGLVIVHPRLNTTGNPVRIETLEPDIAWQPILSSARADLPFLISKTISPVTNDTSLRHSIGCVWIPRPNFVACTFTPIEDFLKAGSNLKARNDQQIMILSIVYGVLLVAEIVLCYSWTLTVAQPIQAALLEHTQSLHDLRKELPSGRPICRVDKPEPICAEMKHVDQSMEMLTAAMRLNQLPLHDRSKTRDCLLVIKECLTIFEKQKPNGQEMRDALTRAISVVLNNQALLLHRLGEAPKTAISLLEGSIQRLMCLSRHHLHDTLALASRWDNLGVMQLNQKDMESAMRSFIASRSEYRKVDAHEGIAKVSANLVALYRMQGLFPMAEAALQSALEILRLSLANVMNVVEGKPGATLEFPQSKEGQSKSQTLVEYLPFLLIQYAWLLRAQFSDAGTVQRVRNIANYVLTQFPRLETTICRSCERLMVTTDPRLVQKKRGLFIVDTSGSMAGEPIRALREQLIQMIESDAIFHDTSEIAILRFSSDIRHIFPDSHWKVRGPVRGEHAATFRNIVNTIHAKIHASGPTPLYRAILRGYTEMNALPRGTCDFVCVLTDGQDTSSYYEKMETLRLIRDNAVDASVRSMIVVIGNVMNAEMHSDLETILQPNGGKLKEIRNGGAQGILEAFHAFNEFLTKTNFEAS